MRHSRQSVDNKQSSFRAKVTQEGAPVFMKSVFAAPAK
jgi:hypothetical protein